MFCARSRPTNKGNREQKPITKKLAEFHNQFVLLTMDKVITEINKIAADEMIVSDLKEDTESTSDC